MDRIERLKSQKAPSQVRKEEGARPCGTKVQGDMLLTIIGCGDAFGSGGRFNTCFWLETSKSTLLIDCGASSLVALKTCGLDHNSVDGIVLSHLHGDHFGGLPFLLLDAQFLARRERPLLIAGPPGTRARLDSALEVFFPSSTANKWRFPWQVLEIAVGHPTDVLGNLVTTTEVRHPSGAPSTAIRLFDGKKLIAYSGDTEWVDTLSFVADGTDLFIVECYGYSGQLPGHITWEILKPRLMQLNARRILLTHMNPTMLGRLDEIEAAGVEIAEDGAVVEI
jgi:ribonuclease BN (tRNA processing enzyme)